MARVISGSSQVVRVRRGAVSESEKEISDRLYGLLGMYRSIRVRMLISRLQSIMLIHSMWSFDSHVIGNNIVVGKIIFNIVEGLGFVRNLGHINWRSGLAKLGPLRLHMRRILGGQWVLCTLVLSEGLRLLVLS